MKVVGYGRCSTAAGAAEPVPQTLGAGAQREYPVPWPQDRHFEHRQIARVTPCSCGPSTFGMANPLHTRRIIYVRVNGCYQIGACAAWF